MSTDRTWVGALKRQAKELRWVARGAAQLGADVEAFPPAERALPEGVLAVGGDLSPLRLLAAYRRGIFPYFGPGEPLLWHCPDPRYVLPLEQLRFPKDVPRLVRRNRLELRLDTAFEQVVRTAAAEHSSAHGTWISEEVVWAYLQLHRLGYAHCAEAWEDGELKAGLYGVALGQVWFGESMFTRVSNGGSVLFAVFTEQLRSWGFRLVDSQVHSAHLERFGQQPWPREKFLAALAEGIAAPGYAGPWELAPRAAVAG
jgi:leucyl/phenylalanyl-tRNA--protein transferase